MQTHGGQAAADAIEARERSFVERVLVDWEGDRTFGHPLSDLTPYVTGTHIERSLASTLPSELLLVEGASAARMDITLSGHYDGQSLSGQFAPYNGRSVFYATGITLGVTVTYDIGVEAADGIEWFRQFTGVVSEVETDRASNEVRVSCLDNVERFRDLVDVRAMASRLVDAQAGHIEGGRSNLAAVVDLAGRASGFSQGPLARPAYDATYVKTVLSVPLHGSAIPEVGYADNYQNIPRTEEWRDTYPDYADPWVDGPHGLLALNALPPGLFNPNGTVDDNTRADRSYWVDETTETSWGDPHGTLSLSAWVKFDGPGKAQDCPAIIVHNEGLQVSLDIRDSDGMVRPAYAYSQQIYDETPSYGPGLPLKTGWNYVEALFSLNGGSYDYYPAGLAVKVMVNDADTGWNHVDDRSDTDRGNTYSGLAWVIPFYPISDVCVVRNTYANNRDHPYRDSHVVGNAELSKGNLNFAYTMNRDGVDSWTLAKEAAAAEFGAVLFDEHGTFKFWNQDDILSRQDTTARSFTLDDVSGLSFRVTTDSVRNKWSVTTTDGFAKLDTCYDASIDGPMMFAAGGPRDASATAPFTPSSNVVMPRGDLARTWFYVRATENLMSPEPRSIPDLPETKLNDGTTAWDTDTPLKGKINYFWKDNPDPYFGTPGSFDSGDHTTQQKWMGAGYWKVQVYNGYDRETRIWWQDPDGSQFFRALGSLVVKEPPTEMVTQDDESINEYGPRGFDVPDNFWYQDHSSVVELVQRVVSKFAEPVPVTDAITVPGDPRVQLGDTIAAHDPYGMGETIRLQILGINRRRRGGEGLTDTYSVEVIRPPKHWVLGSPAYSILGRSTVLTDTGNPINVNPGFTEGLYGWIGEASSIDIAADTGQDGGPICKMTPDSSANWPYLYPGLQGFVPVNEGRQYSFEVAVKLQSRHHIVGLQLLWLDKAQKLISVDQYQKEDVPVDQWWHLWMNSFTAPDAAWYLKPRCYLPGDSTPDDVMYIDHMNVTAG